MIEDNQLGYTVFFKGRTLPRWISAAQRDNMDLVRLAGISLPKPNVILDQMLIYTG
jgi:hypothetical protein